MRSTHVKIEGRHHAGGCRTPLNQRHWGPPPAHAAVTWFRSCPRLKRGRAAASPARRRGVARRNGVTPLSFPPPPKFCPPERCSPGSTRCLWGRLLNPGDRTTCSPGDTGGRRAAPEGVFPRSCRSPTRVRCRRPAGARRVGRAP
jgi:hypothetical protein